MRDKKKPRLTAGLLWIETSRKRFGVIFLVISLSLWQSPLGPEMARADNDDEEIQDPEEGFQDPQGPSGEFQDIPGKSGDAQVMGGFGNKFVPGELIVKLKEGADPSSLQALNQKYAVTSTERIFQDIPAPEETLKTLKDQLAALSPGHPSWYWWADKDSPESKDYQTRIAKEKEQLEAQIKAKEDLIARLAQRQGRAPQGATPPSLKGIYLLKAAPGTDIQAMAAEYQAHPAVQYAQPNSVVKVQAAPNDPYYASKGSWGQGYDDLWGLKKIQAEQAWDLFAKGGRPGYEFAGQGVIVAVVDTGIDYNHEDIAPNVWTNLGEIPNNGKDDDGNGYIDDAKGWDFTTFNCTVQVPRPGQATFSCKNKNPDKDPMDGYGHGTHVAGTIAAVAGNGKGVAGVAPKAKVMALKGLDNAGSGAISDLAKAIVYAADNGADIINNSWGGVIPGGFRQIVVDAVDYAHSKGCVIVAAAGNSDTDAMIFTPAHIDNVITVASTNHNDQRSTYSNWGHKIDVAAPGGDGREVPEGAKREGRNILSLRASGTDMYGNSDAFNGLPRGTDIVGSKYYRSRGTSMASPHVAGVAALILSRHPGFGNEEVRQVLRGTADDIDTPSYDLNSGYGRINAYQALLVDDPKALPVAAISSPQDGDRMKEGMIEIRGTASCQNFASYEIKVAQGVFPIRYSTVQISKTPVTDGVLASWDTSTSHEGYNTVLVEVKDTAGRKAYAWVRIFVVRHLKDGWPVSTPGWITSPVLADLDHDGKLEVIAGSKISRGVPGIYAWHPDGTIVQGFSVDPDTFFGFVNPPTVADLDMDGNLEVMGANPYEDAMGVWHGDGTQARGWPRRLKDATWATLAAADMNGNGDMEMVVGGGVRGSGVISLLDHRGTILWSSQPGVIASDADPAFAASFSVGDLDGRGGKELVVSGYFNPPQVFALDDQGMNKPGWPVRIPSPFSFFYMSDPAIGDLKGDGTQDVVVATYEGLYAWDPLGNELPGWKAAAKWAHAPDSAISHSPPALGDLDGDGKLEIVFGTRLGKVYVVHSDNTMAAGWPVQIEEGNYRGLSSPVLADIDGDGRMDIVIASQNGNLYAFHSDGSAVNGWPIGISLRPFLNGLNVSAPAVGDLDGDGKVDVAASLKNSGRLYVFGLEAPYDPRRAAWPMFKHDARHTGQYTCPAPHVPSLFVPIGDQRVDEMQTLTVSLTPTVSATAGWSYTASGLPPGATFNPVSRTFSWAPTYDQAGEYFVTFKVSNGNQTDSETVKIFVRNVNRPPSLSPVTDITTRANKRARFTLQGSDPDGDLLSFQVLDQVPGLVLDDPSASNPNTVKVTWRSRSAGTWKVRFEVSDGQLSATQTATFTATPEDNDDD